MGAYNRNFDLDLVEMDLIEKVLRDRVRHLSEATLTEVNGAAASAQEELRAAKSLLGKLHNQKVFYRPRKGIYVGG